MGFWKTLKWNAAAISIGSVVLGVILAGWPAIAARTVCYLLAAVLLLGAFSYLLSYLSGRRQSLPSGMDLAIGLVLGLAALGANLLHLKPCIEVVDGKMKVGKKYRGPFEKCLLSYVKDRLDGRDDLVKDRIFVTHTPCDAKTVEAVKKSVKQYGGFSQVVETQAGCTISSHCGPNTLGVLFIRK